MVNPGHLSKTDLESWISVQLENVLLINLLIPTPMAAPLTLSTTNILQQTAANARSLPKTETLCDRQIDRQTALLGCVDSISFKDSMSVNQNLNHLRCGLTSCVTLAIPWEQAYAAANMSKASITKVPRNAPAESVIAIPVQIAPSTTPIWWNTSIPAQALATDYKSTGRCIASLSPPHTIHKYIKIPLTIAIRPTPFTFWNFLKPLSAHRHDLQWTTWRK
jgi:hypothetical protein